MNQIKFNNIRHYREKNNMTLKELSKLTNLSVGYLSHLENGSRSNPSFNAMSKISIALNTSMDKLFNI